MDRELDYWVCDQLQIPRKEFTWDDVIYYKVVTSLPGHPTEYKKWPKRDKNQYGSTILRVLINKSQAPEEKYRARCVARYRIWGNQLAYTFGSKRRWQQSRPLSEQYIVLIKQILKYRLTYDQYRERHFKSTTDFSKGYIITTPEISYTMI